MLNNYLNNSGYSKLSISIPTFNEEESIVKMINNCVSVLGDNPNCLELIIVNDCSTDNTEELANELSQKFKTVRLINNISNIGCHPSQIQGWNNATGDLLYVLPSDNQIPPDSIFSIINQMKNNDIVWTNRYLRKDNIFRRLISFLYNFISKNLFKIHSSDIDSAVMISNEKYKILKKHIDSKSAFIQVQIGFISSLMNFQQTEVDIDHVEREFGSAKGLNLHDIIWVPKELIRLIRQKKEILKNI